jgi:hypothetical protein
MNDPAFWYLGAASPSLIQEALELVLDPTRSRPGFVAFRFVFGFKFELE